MPLARCPSGGEWLNRAIFHTPHIISVFRHVLPHLSIKSHSRPCYNFAMSKLLEQAIESLRDLPEDEQDAAASALLSYISSDERHYHLTSDQAEAVRQTRRDLKTGKTRLATGVEVAALRATARL